MHERIRYMGLIEDTLLNCPNVEYPQSLMCRDCLQEILENLKQITDIELDANIHGPFTWLCTASCHLKSDVFNRSRGLQE